MKPLWEWIRNNKLPAVLGLATFSLFVSTMALSAQKANTQFVTCNQLSSESINGSRGWPRTSNNINASYRLPRHIIPKNYQLQLNPNLIKHTFEGRVTISIDILRPSKRIILHSNNLTITTITLLNSNNKEIKVEQAIPSLDAREFLIVKLEKEVIEGDYSLHISYSGTLVKGFIGLYASTLKKGGEITLLWGVIGTFIICVTTFSLWRS